jgi:hypothetical protein
MAKCSSCGTESAPNARFCAICGAPVGAPAQPSPPLTPSVAPAPLPESGPVSSGLPPATWAGIGGGVLVLGIAGFLFAKAAGLFGAPAPAPKSTAVLAAPQTDTAPAPVLAAPQTDSAPTPVLQAPAGEEVPMPEDVIAYLRWLKRFDEFLRDVNSRLEAVGVSVIPEIYTGMISQITGDGEAPQRPAGTGVVERLSGISNELNALSGQFRQNPPPEPCAPLAAAYSEALAGAVRGSAQMVTVFGKVAASFSGDVSQGAADRQQMLPDLMKEMQGGALSGGIDKGFENANAALDAVRARYTRIPSDIDRGAFSIKAVDSGLDASKLLGGTKLGF